MYTCQALVISRKKLAGFADHVGVLFPNGAVAHCSPGAGAKVTSLEDFSESKTYLVVRPVPYERYSEMIRRIAGATSERKPYNVLWWNCEHFVNWVTGEPVESAQIGWVALGLMAVLALALVTRD